MLLLYLFLLLSKPGICLPLHSIMLLLYPRAAYPLRSVIPSTFHYASTLSFHPEPSGSISAVSTFHYASTLSNVFASFSFSLHFSTFHYASTLSVQIRPANSKTMFLYIPLCFYFIPLRTRYRCRGIPSTFHYASTLSSDSPARFFSGRSLHSIMLLLYPVSFFSPYFLLFRPIFCPPSFLFIFPLQKHPCQISKMQFYLDSSSFVYLLEILHYFKSTITESCSFYHHPLPKIL